MRYFYNFAVNLVFSKYVESLTMKRALSIFVENTKVRSMIRCKILIDTQDKMLLS